MKTVMRPLLIAVLALPFLTLSKAYAGGPGFPPPFTTHRLSPSDGPYLQRESFDWSPLNENRNRINDDRMTWNDPFTNRSDSQPNGGGASAPLDGGISLLLAAGIGLGLKKATRKNKSSHEEGKVISSTDDQI
jgi:hypothetical protein